MCAETKVLSINIRCCGRCPNILKKKILKMPGVDSVSIDTEEDLVYVDGIIDATTLVNKVAKLGKPVHLLSGDKHPRKHGDKEKQHSNCCCRKKEHKCEAYVPPSVDPRVCRDFFCRTHPRGGHVIVDRVPAESSGTFFGSMIGMPIHGGYGPPDDGGWYQQQPSQYGYGWPLPRWIPKHPFLFQ